MPLPVKPKIELLHLLPDESFRLLRWNERDVTDVEAIGADGRTHPFKGAGDVWHCHPGMELVLITRGSGTRLAGDSIAGFKAMDLVLLGSNLPHCWHTTRPLSGYALQFGAGPEHPFGKLPEMKDLGTLWQNAQKGIQFTGKVAREVAGWIQSLPAHRGVGRLARFLIVMDQLRQAPDGTWKLLSQKSYAPSRDPSGYHGIQKAIERILSSFHEDLTFAEVLAASGMSKATFERRFKSHTGKTLTRFLIEVRIDSARRSLIETNLPIGEIAFASGFNNLSHFNHQFALIQRETPGAFRKRIKEAQVS
jgi:AraC-like DNA-binding protein